MSDKLQDYSDNLVGKVSEELAFDENSKNCSRRFRDNLLESIKHIRIAKLFWCKIIDIDNYDYGLQIVSGWFVTPVLKMNTTLFTYIQALAYLV